MSEGRTTLLHHSWVSGPYIMAGTEARERGFTRCNLLFLTVTGSTARIRNQGGTPYGAVT